MSDSHPITATLPPMPYPVYANVSQKLSAHWRQLRPKKSVSLQGIALFFIAFVIAFLCVRYLDARLELAVDALEWLAIVDGWKLALLFLGFAMVVVGCTLLVLQKAYRDQVAWLASTMHALNEPAEITADSHHWRSRTSMVEAIYPWSAFTHLIDIPEGFGLVADMMYVHFVSKDVPQYAELRALVERCAPALARLS